MGAQVESEEQDRRVLPKQSFLEVKELKHQLLCPTHFTVMKVLQPDPCSFLAGIKYPSHFPTTTHTSTKGMILLCLKHTVVEGGCMGFPVTEIWVPILATAG